MFKAWTGLIFFFLDMNGQLTSNDFFSPCLLQCCFSIETIMVCVAEFICVLCELSLLSLAMLISCSFKDVKKSYFRKEPCSQASKLYNLLLCLGIQSDMGLHHEEEYSSFTIFFFFSLLFLLSLFGWNSPLRFGLLCRRLCASLALQSISLSSWNILVKAQSRRRRRRLRSVCRYEQPACVPLGIDDTHIKMHTKASVV